MAFKKNDPNINRKGRPKGSKNKSSKEAKALFIQIINNEMPRIKKSLRELRQKDVYKYLVVLKDMMKHVFPELSAIQEDNSVELNIKLFEEATGQKLEAAKEEDEQEG